MKWLAIYLVRVACGIVFLAAAAGSQTRVWVEETFDDFRDGKLDAAGQNIYVSRDGTIRTIHRFDLN